MSDTYSLTTSGVLDPHEDKIRCIRDLGISISEHNDIDCIFTVLDNEKYDRVSIYYISSMRTDPDIIQMIINHIPKHVTSLVLHFDELHKSFVLDFPEQITNLCISSRFNHTLKSSSDLDSTILDKLPVGLEALGFSFQMPIINPPPALKFLCFYAPIKEDYLRDLFCRFPSLEKIHVPSRSEPFSFSGYESKKSCAISDYFFYHKKY